MSALACARAIAAVVAAAAGAAACSSFEDEDIVLDMRVLAMSASVPEQVVVIDLSRPPDPGELLAQLDPSEMCALVADPAHERRIRWSMTLCVLDSDQKCHSDAKLVLASAVAEDPDTARPAPRLCATVPADASLLAVLLESLEGDVVAALGGVEYGVELTVGAEGEPPASDLRAGKRLRVAPRIPEARRANVNPSLARIEASVEGITSTLALGRCVDQPSPLELRPGQRMRLDPIEAEGAREVYVVPRLDGEQQTFTESLTYQWLASAGGLSAGSTGGPRDVAGNPPPLHTEYRAPAAKDLAGPTDVGLWIVQRDERLGSTWYESCVRVVP